MAVLSFFAFLSGIVTVLSPCILPVLPLVLSGSVGGRRKPLGVVAGFVLSFTAFTLLLSSLVQALSLSPDALRWVALAFIGLLGTVLLVPPLQLAFEGLASRLVRVTPKGDGGGFFGGLVLGASLGMVWTPCVGPIMASVITLAVTNRVDGGSAVIALSYSLGTAVPMFAVMAGGRKLLAKVPWLQAATGKIQRVFGAVMILIAVAMGFGLDRRFQTAILTLFPSYGSGLTAIENATPVRDALNRRAASAGGVMASDGAGSGSPRPLSADNPPRNGTLGDYGPAPEIVPGGAWINSGPLTLESLRGKVVLVDFWTYSCVNCVRTLPYLREWQETYGPSGLVILGVHSPEFPFERNEGNLRKAVADLGVTWPVVQDNAFATWRAYGNRYWPAHYFIDAKGRVRYYAFGEGDYDVSERVIRELLAEAGMPLPGMAEARAATVSGANAGNRADGTPTTAAEANDASGSGTMTAGSDSSVGAAAAPAPGGPRTGETYLGYGRGTGFLSEVARETPGTYALPRSPKDGEWGLEGTWTIRREFIENEGDGALEMGFRAGRIFLVIEVLEAGSAVRVTVDGSGAMSPDVANSRVRLDGNRLYELARFGSSGSHRIRLDVEGRVRFYAFTFG